MIHLGVIGVGYWGPNIIRNAVVNRKFKVTKCADLKQSRLDYIASLYPTVHPTKTYKEIIADPKITAIAICTPAGCRSTRPIPWIKQSSTVP